MSANFCYQYASWTFGDEFGGFRFAQIAASAKHVCDENWLADFTHGQTHSCLVRCATGTLQMFKRNTIQQRITLSIVFIHRSFLGHKHATHSRWHWWARENKVTTCTTAIIRRQPCAIVTYRMYSSRACIREERDRDVILMTSSTDAHVVQVQEIADTAAIYRYVLYLVGYILSELCRSLPISTNS